MADRLDHLQDDQLIGEQLQCPVSVAWGWRTQTHRDQLRFGLAVEFGWNGSMFAGLAMQSQFKAFVDESFA